MQVIYNVFDQAPEDELLAACERYDVGVIARVPFDEGGLTGRITARTRRSRRATSATSYFSGDRSASRSTSACRRSSTTSGSSASELPEVALRYVLCRPEVSTVIPGMRTVRNVERNARSATGAGLPDEQVAALKAHRWDLAGRV